MTWWTPILKDFRRRISPPTPRFQSPSSTPFNSNSRLSTPPRHRFLWNDPQILPSDSDDDAPYEHDDALPPSTLFTGEGVVVEEDGALADDDDGSISLALTNVASARRKPNAPPESMKNLTDRQARSMSHWSPYDPVGVVNADP